MPEVRLRVLENDVTDLIAVPRLTGASSGELEEQTEARRALSARLLGALRAASTPREAVAALRLHDGALEQLGRHDEAARLRALARAVDADFAEVEREVVELQARADHFGG
jgi:hypothetical protein